MRQTDKVAPLCLHTDATDPPGNSTLLVTGWGTIDTRSRFCKQPQMLDENLNLVEYFYLFFSSYRFSAAAEGSAANLSAGTLQSNLCRFWSDSPAK